MAFDPENGIGRKPSPTHWFPVGELAEPLFQCIFGTRFALRCGLSPVIRANTRVFFTVFSHCVRITVLTACESRGFSTRC